MNSTTTINLEASSTLAKDTSAEATNPWLSVFSAQSKQSTFTFNPFPARPDSEKGPNLGWKPATLSSGRINSTSPKSSIFNSSDFSDSGGSIIDTSGRSAFGTPNPIGAVLFTSKGMCQSTGAVFSASKGMCQSILLPPLKAKS